MKNSKHLIIVALVAIFVCGQASAEFRFGVKAGLNINKLHTSSLKDNFSSENRAGFTAGVMTEFTVPVIGIGFDLSLMYTHMNNELVNDNVEGSVGKNFLEIPLNLKYKINLPAVNSIIRPMIFTGPTLATKLDKSTFKTSNGEEFGAKTVQMGWNIGLGVELVKHLQICGGYTIGMNNVAKKITAVNNTFNIQKIKNNYWTVTAAYLF